jgi:2-methylcitrate dehydratase PrpD
MADALLQRLATFSVDTSYDTLPQVVTDEVKRLTLDTIGCALGGLSHPKGTIGVRFGKTMGGDEATILGTGDRVSVIGAAFANSELAGALDYHAILPPGHVAPHAVAVALAAGESAHASGKQLIAALAVAHEISCRLGNAMSQNRDVIDGRSANAPVLGYACTTLGIAAAAALLRGQDRAGIAHTIAIAAATSPVNAHKAWCEHAPAASIKYQLAFPQAAVTAAYMAELGHTGDLQILDDPELGYWRMIGSIKWEPQRVEDGLGQDWVFPRQFSYKPYPHCRVNHATLDILIDLMAENGIKPDEIEGVRAFGEGWAKLPTFMNRDIRHVTDAQMAFAHGLAIAASGIKPGKRWQYPETVFDPTILALMEKVTWEPNPAFFNAYHADPASRPSRVEIDARSQTFVGEKSYPKGSPSPDPKSYMTTDEIVEKFLGNAEGVLSPRQADRVIDAVLNLEKLDDAATLARFCTGAGSSDRPPTRLATTA